MRTTYKYKIDQDLLTKFLLGDDSQDSLKELEKVVFVVLVKHYPNYVQDSDLKQQAVLAVLSRRDSYDPSFSAYNYIYTICRNEISNKVRRSHRELPADNILTLAEGLTTFESAELPTEIEKFRRYLTSEKSFTVLELTEKDAINLYIFINSIKKPRLKKVPEFYSNCPYLKELMYKFITDE